jgi:hypothetical protein
VTCISHCPRTSVSSLHIRSLTVEGAGRRAWLRSRLYLSSSLNSSDAVALCTLITISNFEASSSLSSPCTQCQPYPCEIGARTLKIKHRTRLQNCLWLKERDTWEQEKSFVPSMPQDVSHTLRKENFRKFAVRYGSLAEVARDESAAQEGVADHITTS